jgi:O-antigen/teichoic acid export membrane protein
MSELRRRIRTGLHFTLWNRVIINGVPAAVALLAVRLVSTAEFGIFNVFAALSGLIGKITSMGWPETIARYVPRLDAEDARPRLAGFLIDALRWRFVMAGGIAAVMVLGFGVIAPVLKLDGYLRPFTIFAAALVLDTQNFLLTAALESLLRQKALSIIGAVTGFFQAAFLAALFLFNAGSLEALVWMKSLTSALLYLLQAAAVLRALGATSVRSAWVSREPFRDPAATRYRWFSYVNDVGQELLSPRSNFLLLSYLGSSVQVAVYALAVRVLRFVEMLVPVALFKGALESAVYRVYERGSRPDRLNIVFQSLAKINLTVLGVFLAITLVYSPGAFAWAFGPAYQGAAAVFSIFIVFLALYYYPLGFALRAIERMDLVLWPKLTFVIGVVLAVFLVPRWGAVGMALATTAALMAKNLIVYWIARRIAGIRMPWTAIARITANVAVTAVLLMGTKAVLGQTWPAILAGIAGGTLAYALLTLVNSGYSPGEIELLADMLPRQIGGNRVARAMFGLMRTRAGERAAVPAP